MDFKRTEEFLSNDFITIHSSPLAFVLNRLTFMVICQISSMVHNWFLQKCSLVTAL